LARAAKLRLNASTERLIKRQRDGHFGRPAEMLIADATALTEQIVKALNKAEASARRLPYERSVRNEFNQVVKDQTAQTIAAGTKFGSGVEFF